MDGGASSAISFCSLSAMPGNLEVPPESNVLAHKTFYNSSCFVDDTHTNMMDYQLSRDSVQFWEGKRIRENVYFFPVLDELRNTTKCTQVRLEMTSKYPQVILDLQNVEFKTKAPYWMFPVSPSCYHSGCSRSSKFTAHQW